MPDLKLSSKYLYTSTTEIILQKVGSQLAEVFDGRSIADLIIHRVDINLL